MPTRSSLTSRLARPLVRGLLAVAAMLLLGLIAWGLRTTYEDRMQRSHHQAERELMTVGHLQAEGVAAWRDQRMADAFALSDDGLLAVAAADWFKTASSDRAAPVQQRLRILQERAKYVAVYLLDARGQLRLAPQGEAGPALPEPEQQALQDALSQAMPVAVEPRVDPVFAFPFFSVIAPLFDGAQPIGAVWLVSDVRSTLLPLLNSWPTPSHSAESSIIMRQDDDVVYLSPKRHLAGANWAERSPLARTQDPAVQVILGARGIFYAQDYRAKDVIAMASAVPGSPWFLVTKIDVAEVLAGTQRRELQALGLPVILGLLLLGILFAIWQRSAWLRERALKTELQRNMHWLEGAQKVAAMGYFAMDVARNEFTLSGLAHDIFRLPQGSQVDMAHWMALIDPEDFERFHTQYQQAVLQRTPLRTQYRIHPDKKAPPRWVEVWGDFEIDDEIDQVTRLIGTVQDITERKQIEEDLARYRSALEEKVRLDPLTQLANRLALSEHVASERQRAMRAQTPLSLMMIDVDHFKAYNDHYGHVAGDHALQRVAQAISGSVNRAGELAARYGGEEFAVLLPDADLSRAQVTAERICAAVRALHIAHAASDVDTRVTVSIGVVCVRPRFMDAPETPSVPLAQIMFEQADAALYQAKQQGRNRVVIFGAQA